MRRIISLVRITIISACLVSCGKYLPPLAPESLAPAAVQMLEVTADLQSVNFKWDASEKDQRGETLKSIDGYRIYRKELEKPSDLINDDIRYELIATVQDIHLAELKKLKDLALEAGAPTRKVKIDDQLKHFSFSDSNLSAGSLYAYQIIPYNQEGEEGETNKIIKVLFRGTTSEIILIDQTKQEIEELE